MDEEKPRRGICYKAKDERIVPMRKLRKVERERESDESEERGKNIWEREGFK